MIGIGSGFQPCVRVNAHNCSESGPLPGWEAGDAAGIGSLPGVTCCRTRTIVCLQVPGRSGCVGCRGCPRSFFVVIRTIVRIRVQHVTLPRLIGVNRIGYTLPPALNTHNCSSWLRCRSGSRAVPGRTCCLQGRNANNCPHSIRSRSWGGWTGSVKKIKKNVFLS